MIILNQLLIDFNLLMDLLPSAVNLILKMIILNKLSRRASLRPTESLKKHLQELLSNNSFHHNQNSPCLLLLQWLWALLVLKLRKNLGMWVLIKQAEFEPLRVRANRTQTSTWFLKQVQICSSKVTLTNMFHQQNQEDQKEASWKEHWVAQRKLLWKIWTRQARSNLKIGAQLEVELWVHQSMLFQLLNLKFRLSLRLLSRMEKRKRVLPKNQLTALLEQIRVTIPSMMRMFSQVPLFLELNLNVL